MILSDLNHTATIEALHPAFKMVFDYVRTHDLLSVPAGRIVLQGDEVFLNVDDATLCTLDEQMLEAHRRYIDIHFPLSGEEIVGWRSMSEVVLPSVEPFNVERDFAFYKQLASTYFSVQPGQFYIMYPEDAHAPIIGQGTLRKIVAKVRLLED